MSPSEPSQHPHTDPSTEELEARMKLLTTQYKMISEQKERAAAYRAACRNKTANDKVRRRKKNKAARVARRKSR